MECAEGGGDVGGALEEVDEAEGAGVLDCKGAGEAEDTDGGAGRGSWGEERRGIRFSLMALGILV